MKYDFYIRGKEDLVRAVNHLGFLPFFRNSVEGFSIEEHVDPKIWFGDIEGLWEWKGPDMISVHALTTNWLRIRTGIYLI